MLTLSGAYVLSTPPHHRGVRAASSFAESSGAKSHTRRDYTLAMNRRLILLLLVVAVALLSGCRPTTSTSESVARDSVQTERLSAPQASGNKLFRLRTSDETGIDLVHQFPANASVDMLSDQTSGMGVCIGDVDNDGLPDVFVANYDQGNRLYRNLGKLRFADITRQAGVAGEGNDPRWCSGPNFVDIDNDGDLDLHVCVLRCEQPAVHQ